MVRLASTLLARRAQVIEITKVMAIGADDWVFMIGVGVLSTAAISPARYEAKRAGACPDAVSGGAR